MDMLRSIIYVYRHILNPAPAKMHTVYFCSLNWTELNITKNTKA